MCSPEGTPKMGRHIVVFAKGPPTPALLLLELAAVLVLVIIRGWAI